MVVYIFRDSLCPVPLSLFQMNVCSMNERNHLVRHMFWLLILDLHLLILSLSWNKLGKTLGALRMSISHYRRDRDSQIRDRNREKSKYLGANGFLMIYVSCGIIS